MEANQHQIGELEAINVNEFAAKFKSKREIYTFLTIDAGAYLPSHEVLTIYFLKDLVRGKKKCKFVIGITQPVVVHVDRVRHLFVPQYENLSIQHMLDFLKDFPEMHVHMPSERREVEKLPRDFVINVGCTIVNEPFLRFVKEAIIARNQKMSQDRNMLI